MGNLTEGVHPAIRAACAVDFHVTVKNNISGFAQFSRDGAGVFLLLPAAVARAIVFKKQFVSDQDCSE
jgi:hypothetical protein